MQQIMKNFRNFKLLLEREERALQQPVEAKKEAIPEDESLVNINAGPAAVLAAAGRLVQDPNFKNVMLAGRTDAAGPDDEILEIVPDTRFANKLTPTQSQIGTGQSLDDQASNNDFGKGSPTNLDRAIAGGRIASKTGLFPILVFKNHILDGHHRWSQFIATNPNAEVDVAEIIAPGVEDEEAALGLAHYINFTLYGISPTKTFKGVNIYTMSFDGIKEQALKNMSEETPKKLFEAGLIEEPSAESAANHFANNLSNIAGPGKFPRIVMPQAADAGDPTGLTVTPEKAKTGAINYNKPVIDDLK